MASDHGHGSHGGGSHGHAEKKSHGGGGGGGSVQSALADVFKLFVAIGIIVAVYRQGCFAITGDPHKSGAIQGEYERRTGRKPGESRDSSRSRMTEAEMAQAEYEFRTTGKRPPKIARTATASSAVTAATLQPADASKAKALGISERNYAAIAAASAKYQVPAGLLYGIKISESGYREDHPGGNCLAYEQYAVRDRWLGGNPRFNRQVDGKYYTNGEANTLALQVIARNIGRDWKTIVGSCGHSTMTKRDRDFGGCIGSTQITPVEWINDPEFRDKDPFDIYWATMWVAKRFGKGYAKWASKGLDHDEARAKSTLQYPGNPDGWYAWNYYVNKAMPKWRKWNQVHGVDAPGDKLASN